MNVSTKLLTHLIDRNEPAAMRQLARMILEGKAVQPDRMKLSPRHLLLAAALSNDRKAGWLLCSYYLTGKYGFRKSFDCARRWMECTERRLFSDSQLLYIDSAFEVEARLLYQRWRRWLATHWPEEGPAEAAGPTGLEATRA